MENKEQTPPLDTRPAPAGHDWMNDPAINEMFAHRDTRLLFGAVWCGLLIKEGHRPNPEAVEYLQQEYSPDELESAAAELDTDAANVPRLADTFQHGAAFIREQVLQRGCGQA